MTPLASCAICGQGAPVLLIHGSMNSKSNWRPLAESLKCEFSVIATDLTGYGDTAFPKDPGRHTLLDEVEIIRQTLSTAAAIEMPLHIVAHSYGGAVALGYACRYPEEIQSLILFEPMAMHLLLEFDLPQIFHESRRLIDHIAQLVADQNPMDGARAFVDYFSGQGAFSRLTANAQSNLSRYVRKMLVDYRTAVDTDLSMTDYRNIHCPICLITGQSSSHIPLSISRLLIDELADLRWIEVPGNHMAPYTNPNEVIPAIAIALQQHSAANAMDA